MGRKTNGNMGTCQKCKQRVIWVQMKSGKSMPCNPELVTYRVPREGKGPERIVTPNGEVVSAEIVHGVPQDATGIGYISHFATCPAADMFRRK